MSLVWLAAVVLVALSAWAAVVDARTRRIPNACCAGVAACGVCLQLARLVTGVIPPLGKPLMAFVVACAVLLAGFAVEMLYRRVAGRAGLGLGDVKLAAAWAVSLGWLVVPAFAVACLLGAVWALATRQRTFALGPWLSAAFAGALLLACLVS